jgi:uncharacterized protein YndB with AHSA1/START domain
MAIGLFYRGPDLDVLHNEFAKQHRIDPQASVQARGEVIIEAPTAVVWSVLADVAHWPTWQPTVRDVVLDGQPTVDAAFTWSNGRTRMKSRFAVVDHEKELTWTGTAAGGRAVHRVTVAPTPAGRCHVVSEESMAGFGLPLFFPSTKAQAALELLLAQLKSTSETGERRVG